jgi:hypothetical protein
MDQYITKLKELNDEYELKIKDIITFDNQKKIVQLSERIGYIINKIYWLNRSMCSKDSSILESLCDVHEWEIDSGMCDGHTSRYCVKCNKYFL